MASLVRKLVVKYRYDVQIFNLILSLLINVSRSLVEMANISPCKQKRTAFYRLRLQEVGGYSNISPR